MATRTNFKSMSFRTGLAAALLAFSGIAAAQTVTGTIWTCWYNGDTTVRCVLAESGSVDASTANNVTNMPQIARALRYSPEQFAGKQVAVPTYSPPTDWDNVKVLAESAVCGSRADCTVNFFRSLIEVAALTDLVEE
jgi:hypothetical protein